MIQDASPPLLLLFYITHFGRVPDWGKPPGLSPGPYATQTLSPGPRPRASRRALASAPARLRLNLPAGTALSCPSQSAETRGRDRRPRPSCQDTNWSAKPSLTRSHSVPAFHPPLQENRRLGLGGQRHTESGGASSRGVREGGTAGRRWLTRRREAQPSQSPLH